MAELVTFVLSLVVTTALVFLIVWRDERRLDPERLDRAWPATTRIAAVVAFGPLCLPVHFWRTRRSLVGVVLGFGWAIAVVVANVLVAEVVDLVAG